MNIFHKYVKYIEGLLSTNMVDDILNILNPTMSYQAGNIASIPFIFDDSKLNKINEIVDECILLAKKDWNYYETSYDFRNNPIIEQNDCNIRNALTKHSDLIKKDFNRLKELATSSRNARAEIRCAPCARMIICSRPSEVATRTFLRPPIS